MPDETAGSTPPPGSHPRPRDRVRRSPAPPPRLSRCTGSVRLNRPETAQPTAARPSSSALASTARDSPGPAPRPACPPPTSPRASAAPRTASKEAGSAPTTTPPPPRQQQSLRHAQFGKTTYPHFTCFADRSERMGSIPPTRIFGPRKEFRQWVNKRNYALDNPRLTRARNRGMLSVASFPRAVLRGIPAPLF